MDRPDEVFWLDDPIQLFNLGIIPESTDSRAARFNAITRLIILITILLYVIDTKYWLYFLLLSLTMVIIVYYTSGEKEGYNYIPVETGTSKLAGTEQIYVPRIMDEQYFGGRMRPMNARDVYAPVSLSDDVSSETTRYLPDAEDPEMYYSTRIRDRAFPSRTADRLIPPSRTRVELATEPAPPPGKRRPWTWGASRYRPTVPPIPSTDPDVEGFSPSPEGSQGSEEVEGFSYGSTLLPELRTELKGELPPDGSPTLPKYRTPIRVVEEPEDSFYEEQESNYPDFKVPEVERPEMTMVDVPDVPEEFYRKTTVEPGGEFFVYNDSHRNLAHNIGMTEMPAKMKHFRYKTDDGSTVYHSTDKYEDVQEDGDYKHMPDNSYVYDPRFTGYGDPDRVGWEPLGGQVQYWYRDVEAYTRPNFISSSKVDHIDFIDPSGKLLPEYKRTASYEDIRRQVKDRNDADTLLFREDMMANLMEKMDAVDWQKRHFSLSSDSFNRNARMSHTK